MREKIPTCNNSALVPIPKNSERFYQNITHIFWSIWLTYRRFQNFLSNFFLPGPWPLRRPPKAAISTSATSKGYQISAEYVSFHMRYCLLIWNENGERLDYVSQNGSITHTSFFHNCLLALKSLRLFLYLILVRLTFVLFLSLFLTWSERKFAEHCPRGTEPLQIY